MSRSVNVPEVLINAVVAAWNSEPRGVMSVPITEEELFVVWSSKVLQNWKGLVGSTRPGSPYFEVTHNGNNGITYVDAYTKIDHRELFDGGVLWATSWPSLRPLSTNGKNTKGENK